ncbi:hypothetical protein OQ257_05605 [Actinobacillus equuli subsp. equuli]|uniref:Uncharacterized protein n=1 Tax=Actinobacillus equuli subsp. equuli TaxID=202947 RepID=A0A9X4G580_ACTEU|nr:hypothetical protein [Actinobacillus equuli]MDE8034639.1 hypothetical protein [Actinobacillus equuli subsp. equuli]
MAKMANYQGQYVFRKTDKTMLMWTEEGELGPEFTAKPPPTADHEWQEQDDTWILPLNVVKQTLLQNKQLKLDEINCAAQAFVAKTAKLNDTPEFEQATWQAQAEEAVAWFKDNSTPTPKLDLLASLRGIPPEVLRQKAYEKAQAFYQLSFAVAGQRQRYEDALKACETLEQVQAVTPEFTLNLED